VAQYKGEKDPREFFQRVDNLMYEAKKTGKNRVCNLFSPSGC